jgi:cytochrome c2
MTPQPVGTRLVYAALGSACLVLLTAVLLLSAGADLRAQRPPAPSEPMLLSVALPDRPTAGARLFAQKQCIRCHSLVGDDSGVGPDLGRIVFEGTVIDLAGNFWNHSPVMRERMQDLKIQPASMTAREMANLVAFLTAYRYYLTSVGAPGDALEGRRVFVEKRCAECHDPGADYTKLGPGLARYRGRASALFLAQAMWNHGPEMASVMAGTGVPFPTFEGSEMGDLVAYLQAGAGGPGEEPVYFEPGSPSRGHQLFLDKGCQTCHAIGGRGGSGGPDLAQARGELVRSVSEIAGLMWNHSQAMTAELSRRGLDRVTFSGQEMVDIIAYLYFVNYANVRGTPSKGAITFGEKCGSCHSTGGGDRVGPDLATAEGLDEPIAIITAMWNHASDMEQELQRRGLPWPRFEPGEAANVVAFLLSQRAPTEP